MIEDLDAMSGSIPGWENTEAWFDQAIRSVASTLWDKSAAASSLYPPGHAIGAYRVVSTIGSGGMGSVYLAERNDGEIQQQVAIKLLRADGQRADWHTRFLKERQILASLNHPSIVRVLDAGHTEDGRPFLVMEHVEGVPIDRYAASIPVRDALKLFLRVCDGVSHAHGQLVIHRDLKPSNILVDTAARPKVLDFGIARLLSEQGDLTQPAEQLLTPNYASPEQLRGWRQTTSTDIYSLAAVLYKMLTGKAPRETMAHKPLGEFTSARQLNRSVPVDLDFVLAKALRPEPDQRYRSVDDFAGDVRSVLEQRPVGARASSLWYLARKSLRRNWMPVTAAALVLAGLSAGLLVAQRERGIAERRFTDVRQLANRLFDIDAQVAQLQGGSGTRQLIVDTALEYLKRVTVDAPRDGRLALELGTAYMRVARVEGVNISPNLGQTAKADEAAQKAEALINSVLANDPKNRTALLRATQVAHNRMILAGDAHRDAEALRFAHLAITRLDQYWKTGSLNASSDRQEAQQVIITLINVANRFLRAGNDEDAIKTCRRAISVSEATNWTGQAGAARIVLAAAYRAQGDLDEALRVIRESVRMLQPAPGETRIGKVQPYGLALLREGQILGEDQAVSLGRTAEAIDVLRQALKVSEDAALRDAGDFQSQYRVYSVEVRLAAILRHTDPTRALALYDDGLQRISTMTANAATNSNQMRALTESTYPLLSLGRRAEARKRLDGVLDRLRKQGEYPSDRIELDSLPCDALRAEAAYEADGVHFASASAIYDALIRAIFTADAKAGTDLEDAESLSQIYEEAALFHHRAGHVSQAEELSNRRLTLWRQWSSRLPGNAFVQGRLKSAGLHME